MLSEVLKNKSFFHHLYIIDKKIAEQCRKMLCPYCNGPLYFANYLRKPRGERDDLPEEYFIRFSLCCGTEGCRHRVTPPSCRFMGRKVYWHSVILVVVSEWQNKAFSIFKLSKLSGVTRNTINRWIHFYQDVFPSSRQWQMLRGLIPAFIKNNELPSRLINYFLSIKSCAKDALAACLKFLSRGSEFFQKIRAS